MKNPVSATLLNLIPGLGYLYLGERKVFAALLLLSSFVSAIPFFAFFQTYQVTDGWIIASSIILQIAFMADAYLLAKESNNPKK
jgi:uncharacterized membrane protein